MADVSYNPTFRHKNWINNVDRVRAGGPNGFNVRLDAIDNDLHQLSTVVTQIGAAIDQVAAGGPPSTVRKRLDVALAMVSPDSAWFHDRDTGAVRPSGLPGGPALMDLTMPDRIRLRSLRAVGLFPGPPVGLTIRLFRASLANDAQPPDKLAEITGGMPGMTNPYDQTVDVEEAFGTVDLTSFRYVISIAASGISFTNNDTVSLAAVQLFYTSG
jgi:hypothetical protein